LLCDPDPNAALVVEHDALHDGAAARAHDGVHVIAG
jgi:hypothetical protein